MKLIILGMSTNLYTSFYKSGLISGKNTPLEYSSARRSTANAKKEITGLFIPTINNLLIQDKFP